MNHTYRNNTQIVLPLFMLLSLLFYNGCGPKYVSSTTSPKWNEVKIARVAVVPFIIAPDGGEKGLRSAKVDPAGVALITAMFLRGMEGLGYSMIPFDDETKERLSPQGTLPFEVIKSIGEKTGSEAILTGIVTRYEDREGGPVGVRKPASIGFEANLISTVDGTILWSGRYAETQKSLVEDLSMFFTFLRRRGKWLSAEELAKDGVDQVLKSLPKSPLVNTKPLS